MIDTAMMLKALRDVFVDDATGNVNITAVLVFIKNLSEEKRLTVFVKHNVSDLAGLRAVLTPPDDEMYVRSYEERLMQYTTYRCHKVLLLYVPPILLAIGTTGNMLTFAILMLRSMRRLSTYLYLAVLAITDTLVLYAGLLRLWIGEMTGVEATEHAAWTCKLFNAVGYTVSDYSVWLIIAVTLERYVAVCRPLHAHAICRRSRAAPLMVIIFVVLAAVNAHFFWTTDIREFHFAGERIRQCDGGAGYEKLVSVVWPWVDAAIYSFFPFLILSVLNGLIIRRVINARRMRSVMSCRGAGGDGVAGKGAGGGVRTDSSARLTFMLLTISFAFLVTTLPMNVTLIIAAFMNTSSNISLSAASAFKLARTTTSLLMYTNHSINFFLYCATGQKFRHELVRLFCRRRAGSRRRRQQNGDGGGPAATIYTDMNSITRPIRPRAGTLSSPHTDDDDGHDGAAKTARRNEYELVKMRDGVTATHRPQE